MTDLVEIVNKNKPRYLDWGERAEETKKKFLEEFGIEKLKEYAKESNSIERLIYCGKNKSYLIEKITTNSAIGAYFGSTNFTVTSTMMLNYDGDNESFRYGTGKRSIIDKKTAEEKSKKIISTLVKLVETIEKTKQDTLDDYRELEKNIAKMANSSGAKKDFITSYNTLKLWFVKYLNIYFEEKFCSFYSASWTSFICKKLNITGIENDSNFIRNCAISMKMNELAKATGTKKVVVYRALLNEYSEEYDEENKEIQTFVFPANADIYDHEKSFEKNGAVDWVCRAKNINENEIVYLYVSQTGQKSRVKYKCKITKTNVSNSEALDDIEFYKDKSKAKKGKRVRLVLLEKSDAEELVYQNLHDKVEFEAPQSFRRLKKNEVDYIERFFKTDSSGFDEIADTETRDKKEETLEPVEEKELPKQEISAQLDDYCGQNVIFYGVPGCGKSHKIKELLGVDGEGKVTMPDCYYKRILFHPEYSYGDFVGQIVPCLEGEDGKEKKPTYKFKEGPIVQMLKNAYDNEDKHFFLIIEEINRGNAPAIFGDFFQLLDRDEKRNSEYPIDNDEVEKIIGEGKVAIPKNLTILATMNTCDQNVFTLDTAFKRRFRMTRIKNDFDSCTGEIKVGKLTLLWKDFAKAVNEAILINCNDGASAEDKQLGAYFVKKNELEAQIFAEKVLMYLWDDVVKYDKTQLFKAQYKTLDSVIDGFCKGDNVFNEKCEAVAALYEEAKAKALTEEAEVTEE